MFSKDLSKLSTDELVRYAGQLKRVEVDIRQRMAARPSNVPSVGSGARDRVQERLTWLVARVSAKRKAVVEQIAMLRV